ncbi:hypothetical protein ACFQ45_17540 [Rhodanobacter aciditrophus]|uniref:LPXTG cell wall anchor domain-containing protein n=1 Tax=Rhodanobacter aciditrophus TaxID=1623218 RepID=A0ABW4B4K2_9GAMM
MAETIGFIQCSERHCKEIAEVRKASGKRSSLYTVCPACGTNQGNGAARQKYLADNLKVTVDDIGFVVKLNEKVTRPVTEEEKAAISSKQAASSVSEDTENKPNPIPTDKPKAIPTAPPALLGALALAAALLTAVFATRKPSKHKEHTA